MKKIILDCILLSLIVLVLIIPLVLAIDSDGEGIDDSVDNCPTVSNPYQTDSDFKFPLKWGSYDYSNFCTYFNN